MRVTTKTRSKRKEAANVSTRQQPLKNESPDLKRTREDHTTEAAELQLKRTEASMKFVDLHREIEDSAFEITTAPGQTYREAYEALETRIWGPSVFCTPVAVMLRLGGQWIRLDNEIVAKAAGTIAEDQGVKPEFYAKIALRDARHWAKRARRVSWVLPRLGKEVGA